MPASQPNTRQDMNEIFMQLRYLQDLYGQQYENLENNIATYNLANSSLQRNIEMLEKSKSMEGSNIMIGGEGGAYMSAKVGKADKVMTYVGGGYMVDKSLEDALKFLRENGKRGEAMLSKLLAEKQQIERELLDLQYKMNTLQYQQQAAGAQQ